MPASWEEGNAARQPAPEPSANPFVPVDYTSRLQEMPRRAAHGARISYQPGQRYGHGPAGYGAGPYTRMAQTAAQMPMNQPAAWGSPADAMQQGRAAPFNAPQGVPYAQMPQSPSTMQPPMWGSPADAVPQGRAAQFNAPQGVPYAQMPQSPSTMQPPMWGSPADAMQQGRAMQFYAPQGVPYAQMPQPMQTAQWNGGASSGMMGGGPVPYEAYLGGTPQPAAWNSPAGAAPQAVPYAQMFPQGGMPGAEPVPFAPSAQPMQGSQASAQMANPWNAAAGGASLAEAMGETRETQAASDAMPSDANAANAAPAPQMASASPEAPAYLKRRSARHAAGAQEARPAASTADAAKAGADALSSANPADAAASAPRTPSAAPEAPAYLKRRSARHAAGAQETRIAQSVHSASANAEPAAAPRRRRHAAAAQPSEPTATPSAAASSPVEMRDAYSPRASRASSFPEMEQGMAAAFPEGAAPTWNAPNAPEHDGAPSPEAFFAEEAAPADEPEQARDPHALRDPFTPAKSRRGKAAQASAAPARPPVRPWRVVALLVVIAMLLFCLISGGSLIARLSQNERRMNQAREDYRHSMGVDLLSDASRVVLLPEGQTYAPTQTIAAQPVQTPVPTPIIPMNEAAIVDMNRRDTSAVREPEASPAPTSARTRLTAYPKNEMRNLMADLKPLQEENSEVVGHLVIDGLIDEVVVQRNNTYYLTHNYRGSSSNAGAVFADESCTFFKPPENLLLRGQSAVEDKVFAPLWQYVTGGISFASGHTHARLTTLYEDETYVLLAVIQAASDPSAPNYFNYASHPTFTTDADFLQYVQEARSHSLYPINVDVSAGDRLLTLATVGGESCLVLIFKMIV